MGKERFTSSINKVKEVAGMRPLPIFKKIWAVGKWIFSNSTIQLQSLTALGICVALPYFNINITGARMALWLVQLVKFGRTWKQVQLLLATHP